MARDSSLTHRAYSRLREDLLSCRLPPGEKLNIKELAVELSVSLGAVREALARLTSEGFVATNARRGFRAAPISSADLKDLTSVRVIIEGLAIKRSIEIGDVMWESHLVAAYHRLSRTPQRALDDETRLSDDYAAAHFAFHEALTAACDSPWLLRLRRLLYSQSERYRYLAIPLSPKQRNVEAEHEAILHAALAREGTKAADLMTDHLLRTTEYLSMSPTVDAQPGGKGAGHRELVGGPPTRATDGATSRLARKRRVGKVPAVRARSTRSA